MILGPIKKRLRQARVWHNELPWQINGTEVLTQDAPCVGTRTQETALAVELRLDITPTHIYGLLGGRFHPRDSGPFTLSMAVKQSKTKVFSDSIAPSIDKVYWRLPNEFTPAIFRSVMSERQGLPCGTLELNCAASAEIGSNPLVFALLGKALICAVARQLAPQEVADMVLEQRIDAIASLLK